MASSSEPQVTSAAPDIAVAAVRADVASETAALRRSLSQRLQRYRRPIQWIALLAFALMLALATRPSGGGALRWLFRFDPLTSLSASLAGRQLVPGWPWALLFLVGTLLLGRAWCGWLCPLGTLLDLLPARREGPWDSPFAERWRQAKWLLLVLILAAALLGSLTLLILDPLTLLTRTIAGALWPALNWLVTAIEQVLFGIPVLRPAVADLDGVLRGSLLRLEPAAHALNGLAALLLAAVLLANAARRRFWCRYLCPLGGMLALVSRASILQRRVDETQCLACHRCSRSCPMGTIDSDRAFASDPAECIMCLACVESCRPAGIRFRGGWSVASSMPYDPSRRALALTAGAAVVGLSILRTGVVARQPGSFWLQPPGAEADGLLDACVRCGACTQVCPTGGLQPALFQAGAEGLWTPVLVPRLGYCDYACNACGQVCPTGAIPVLSLAEKQQQVIGHASIDQDRCLAWTGDQPCIVCEEVCPVPEKAIWLEERAVPASDGATQVLQLPHVDRSLCIGCGICENLCPLAGPAAIRVWVPSMLG